MGTIASRITSPPRLFTQPFIQTQIKENIKAPRHWPLFGEFTGDRWIPHTNCQLRGKCFHLITSSWVCEMGMEYIWKQQRNNVDSIWLFASWPEKGLDWSFSQSASIIWNAAYNKTGFEFNNRTFPDHGVWTAICTNATIGAIVAVPLIWQHRRETAYYKSGVREHTSNGSTAFKF